jgi:hypothetical protein
VLAFPWSFGGWRFVFSTLLRTISSTVRRFPSVLIGLWAVVIAVGFAWLTAYGSKPHATIPSAARWPSESQLVRSPSLPTLLLFVHPRCPCSRATLAELSVLAAQCPDRFVGHVLFAKPAGAEPNWDQTDLRSAAEAVSGFLVHSDDDSTEARRFGVTASGHALLYDVDGRLLFSGGLTRSRGHAGDNAGRSAIVSILLRGSADVFETPVFGCPLFNTVVVDALEAESCRRN